MTLVVGPMIAQYDSEKSVRSYPTKIKMVRRTHLCRKGHIDPQTSHNCSSRKTGVAHIQEAPIFK